MKETKNGAKGKGNTFEGTKRKREREELSYEWKKIEYFFGWFDADAASKHFWNILKLALIADNEKANEHERSNMIFFYENVKELFENVFEIWKRKKMSREEIMKS
jgi:hypothetical protein